jgi:hypothetical protein
MNCGRSAAPRVDAATVFNRNKHAMVAVLLVMLRARMCFIFLFPNDAELNEPQAVLLYIVSEVEIVSRAVI